MPPMRRHGYSHLVSPWLLRWGREIDLKIGSSLSALLLCSERLIGTICFRVIDEPEGYEVRFIHAVSQLASLVGVTLL